MGLVDELTSDGNRWNRGPTPILTNLALWLVGGLIGMAGLAFGGEGFLIALLGKATTAEVTGVFTTGGRHETKHLSYRFTLADGRTVDGSTGYDQPVFEAKKIAIRYLTLHPEWNAAVGGSRLFDLFQHFLICLSGFLALALILLHRSWFNDDGPPGS
jgi:hypothetical protein